MASSKGRARDRPRKKQISERAPRPIIRSRVKSMRRKRVNTPYRNRSRSQDSVSIPQLVYELLSIDKYNQGGPSFQECFDSPPRRMPECHRQQRLSYETVNRHDSSESTQMSEYAVESRPASVERLMEVMDAANSTAPTSSANSTVSNVSTGPTTFANTLNSARALFKKRSLVHLINNYIKAGIEEGKRKAKRYIFKALSFGVKSGYLIPTDPRGQMFRVCPTLMSSRQKENAESRRKRRIARRGETNLSTTADRKAMRRGILRNKPRSNAPSIATTSRVRYKKLSDESSTKSLSPRENTPGKSPDRSTTRKQKGTRTRAQRKSKTNEKISSNRGQRKRDYVSEDVKNPVKRRRTPALSPKRVLDNRGSVQRYCECVSYDERKRHKSQEDNYEAITEGQKLNQEDESRVEGQESEMNVNDDGIVERRNNNDDDEKIEKASVE